MAMVDAIVTSLVTNVSQLLVQETNLVLNARDQVQSLHAELKFINAFLRRHSDGKRDEVREEVKQIHDVALEAEDVLDEFVIKMAQFKRRNWRQRIYHFREKMVLLRKVAVEVKRINRKLKKIHENKDKYNITNNEGIASERVLIQRRRRYVEEDEVVGFDNDVELVLKKLNTQGSRRDVVSIVGMGGLGKTTLAKKIYNSSFVKRTFDCRAWVDVSQDYNRKELLLKIVESVLSSMKADKLTEDKLVEKLRTGLERKRYMIVLDDVWDKHLWDGIKAAFPDNSKRSRVLITSRLNEVASHASVHTLPHFLPFLNDDDSWKLFSKKVFDEEVCPPKLEQLARQQILPKCKGLPLACWDLESKPRLKESRRKIVEGDCRDGRPPKVVMGDRPVVQKEWLGDFLAWATAHEVMGDRPCDGEDFLQLIWFPTLTRSLPSLVIPFGSSI